MTRENPLIAYFEEKSGNPTASIPFDKIEISDFEPAMKWAMDLAHQRAETLRNQTDIQFDTIILAYENLSTEADFIKALSYSYMTTRNRDGVSEMVQKIGEMHNDLSMEIAFDLGIFQKIRAVHEQSAALALNDLQKKLTKKIYDDFVRSGAELSSADQEIYRTKMQELSRLTNQWTDNYDKSSDFEIFVADIQDLRGVPAETIKILEQEARAAGHESGYLIKNKASVLLPIKRSCENRELRKAIYLKEINIAVGGNHDNGDINLKQARLRKEIVQLLGHEDVISYQLHNRMAKSEQEIRDMMAKIAEKAKKRAVAEIAALQEIAEKDGLKEAIEPWDLPFYTKKLLDSYYGYDEQELRQYLSLDSCLDMIFDHQEKLLGISLQDVSADHPTDNKDIRVLQAVDKETGEILGLIYLDIIERKGKMKGASAAALEKRIVDGTKSTSAKIYIRASLPPATEDTPSLLYFDDVRTLTHEIGHVMHTLCSDTPYESLAGTSVAHDFVELPSQLNERWFSQYDVLKNYARHHKTGKTLPPELLERMNLSQNFGQGIGRLGYLKKVNFDLNLHGKDQPPAQNIQDCEQIWSKDFSLFKNHGGAFSTVFDHLFDMTFCQYVAGYYVYIWADILSADAFDYFKQEGLYNPDISKKLKTLLAAGGTVDPEKLYRDFRGQDADPQKLIEELDLDQTTIKPANHKKKGRARTHKFRPS